MRFRVFVIPCETRTLLFFCANPESRFLASLGMTMNYKMRVQ